MWERNFLVLQKQMQELHRCHESLKQTLETGAGWEKKTTEIIASISKRPKKFKTRLGSRAVKEEERLANPGAILNATEATTF